MNLAAEKLGALSVEITQIRPRPTIYNVGTPTFDATKDGVEGALQGPRGAS